MGLLTNIQDAIVVLLAADPFFTAAPAITVLAERLDSTDYALDLQTAAWGAAVLILTPAAGYGAYAVPADTTGSVQLLLGERTVDLPPAAPPVPLATVTLVARVLLNAALWPGRDAGGAAASTIAEAIAWTLHGATITGLSSALAFVRLAPVQEGFNLVYNSTFGTHHATGAPEGGPHRAGAFYDVVFVGAAQITAAPTR